MGSNEVWVLGDLLAPLIHLDVHGRDAAAHHHPRIHGLRPHPTPSPPWRFHLMVWRYPLICGVAFEFYGGRIQCYARKALSLGAPGEGSDKSTGLRSNEIVNKNWEPICTMGSDEVGDLPALLFPWDVHGGAAGAQHPHIPRIRDKFIL